MHPVIRIPGGETGVASNASSPPEVIKYFGIASKSQSRIRGTLLCYCVHRVTKVAKVHPGQFAASVVCLSPGYVTSSFVAPPSPVKAHALPMLRTPPRTAAKMPASGTRPPATPPLSAPAARVAVRTEERDAPKVKRLALASLDSGAESPSLTGTQSPTGLDNQSTTSTDWDAKLSFVSSEGDGVSACEQAGYYFGASEHGVRGKAGTPGFWAPEMLHYELDGKGRRYGPAADWWSLGCLVYSLLASRGPFTVIGGDTADDNQATLHCEPDMSAPEFSPAARSLINGLLQKDPVMRLGCGEPGYSEVMRHPFFESIDWVAISNKQVEPPFRPTINVMESTKAVRGWSDKDRAKLQAVSLTPLDQVSFISSIVSVMHALLTI
jgi:serine/threonine protein kinase